MFFAKMFSLSTTSTVPKLTVEAMITEYVGVLSTSPDKVEKRMKRLRLICELAGLSWETTLASINVPAGDPTPDYNIHDWNRFENMLVRGTRYGNEQADQATREKQIMDAKRVIGADLTSQLNRTGAMYETTKLVMGRIADALLSHPIIARFYESRDILIIPKGGIAHRQSLLSLYPERFVDIDACFGWGGDNDMGILVNPALEGREIIRKYVIETCEEVMCEWLDCISAAACEIPIDQVTVVGQQICATPTVRRSFSIDPFGQLAVWNNTHPQGVYISNNDSLEFKNVAGLNAHFTLIRYKRAVEVMGMLCSGELLDIAIPHFNDDQLASHFHHFAKPGALVYGAVVVPSINAARIDSNVGNNMRINSNVRDMRMDLSVGNNMRMDLSVGNNMRMDLSVGNNMRMSGLRANAKSFTPGVRGSYVSTKVKRKVARKQL